MPSAGGCIPIECLGRRASSNSVMAKALSSVGFRVDALCIVEHQSHVFPELHDILVVM